MRLSCLIFCLLLLPAPAMAMDGQLTPYVDPYPTAEWSVEDPPALSGRHQPSPEERWADRQSDRMHEREMERIQRQQTREMEQYIRQINED